MESDKGAKKIAGIGSAGVEDVGKRVVDEEVNRIEQGKNGGMYTYSQTTLDIDFPASFLNEWFKKMSLMRRNRN